MLLPVNSHVILCRFMSVFDCGVHPWEQHERNRIGTKGLFKNLVPRALGNGFVPVYGADLKPSPQGSLDSLNTQMTLVRRQEYSHFTHRKTEAQKG